MKKILLSFGLLALLFVCPALAQVDNWETVKKITKENMLVVKTTQGKTLKGTFQSADEGKMSILSRGRTVDIDRSQVKQVYLAKKKNSLLGGVLGGVAGFFIGGYGVGAATKSLSGSVYGGLGGAVGGVLVGQRVGARTRSGYLLYQAP